LSVITAAQPHGGILVDLLVPPERATELTKCAAEWPDWQLTHRQLCDLELLACGGFSPLSSFLGEDDYLAVCRLMRLADGTLWPMPVTLDVPEEVAARAESAGTLALRDAAGTLLAVLHLTQAWVPDLPAEATAVFGTTDTSHPGVEHLLRHTNPWYISGELEVLRPPEHLDFLSHRHTPAQLRAEFARRGWLRVVAFQTRNPMHRAHLELTFRASLAEDANLLIHPVVGVTKPGDIDPSTRVRCYRAILPSYPEGRVMLSLLPLAMRMGGPREALWHAIIRKNYGATHFIVGRDHAGPGLKPDGLPFYDPYAAQELLRRHRTELGVEIVPFRQMVYLADSGRYVPEDEAPPGARVLFISGTQVRHRLAAGLELPHWFSPPEIAEELRRSYPANPAGAL
jgi:sulfate adenylyltransferase